MTIADIDDDCIDDAGIEDAVARLPLHGAAGEGCPTMACLN